MIWWEERFLLEAAKMEKLYWSCVKEAASGYRLTPNEISVLLFCGAMRRDGIRQPIWCSSLAYPKR